MLWGQRSPWGHLGSQGSNFDIHDKKLCNIVQSCDSYMCINMHNSLRPLIYVMGSYVTTGSLGSQKKRAGFVSFQQHTALVAFSFANVHRLNLKCCLDKLLKRYNLYGQMGATYVVQQLKSCFYSIL